MQNTASQTLNSPEFRFNCGFWDGQTARNHNRPYRPAGILNAPLRSILTAFTRMGMKPVFTGIRNCR